MCGPTSEEKSAQAAQAGFSQHVQSNYSQLYQEQQGNIDTLTNSLTPIANAGPNQNGMSAQELAAENTQAINTTAGNYKNAARAVNGQLAGRGGDSGLESGIDAQIKSDTANKAAGQLSEEQLGITQRNADLGRAQYDKAVNGLQTLSGIENPTGAAGAGTSANEASFSEAHTIAQEEAQKAQAIGGLIEGGVGALTGGLGNLDMTGGSSKGEQVQNFLGGM